MVGIALLTSLVADPGADPGLQRGIYAAATRRRAADSEELLLTLLRSPELDPAVDAAIGTHLTSAALTRAWLTRPGRTPAEVAAAASDRRVTVVAAVAAVTGLSPQTYRTCAAAGHRAVTVALCHNQDVDDDIVIEAAVTTTLPDDLSWSKARALGDALALRPAAARALSWDPRLDRQLREQLIRLNLVDPARIDDVAALMIREHPIPKPSDFRSESWQLWSDFAGLYHLSPGMVDTMVTLLEDAAASDATPARQPLWTLQDMVTELRKRVGIHVSTANVDTTGNAEELVAHAVAAADRALAAALWHTPTVPTALLEPIVVLLPYGDGAHLAAARPGDAEALGLLLGADRLAEQWQPILNSCGRAEDVLRHAARFYSFGWERNGRNSYWAEPHWLDSAWLTAAVVGELRPDLICSPASGARVRLLARDMVADRIGDDPEALALLAAMAGGHHGTFAELLDAVADTLTAAA